MARQSLTLAGSPNDIDHLQLRDALARLDAMTLELYNGSVDAPQGRLTLATGTPVMTASVPGATTVYYTPYSGVLCPIFNGTLMQMVSIGGELSQLTTDATKSPAAVAASSVYDMFVWMDGVTPRCTRGPAWTNATTRSLALARVGGILTNSAAITNGPAANYGTYVGTIVSNASSTIDWILGTTASGGGAAYLQVWNMYNRVTVVTRVTDNATAYAYTTGTVRAANGSNNNRITYCIGVAEDAPMFYYQTTITALAAVGAYGQVSIGDDALTFELGGSWVSNNQAVNTITGSVDVVYTKGYGEPIIGSHYAQALELGDGVNANLFNVGTAAELSCVIRM